MFITEALRCNNDNNFYIWYVSWNLSAFIEQYNNNNNTPGTVDGPGSRDQMRAVKSKKIAKFFLLHLSSSYAEILAESKFQFRAFPRSEWKSEDVIEREKKERKMVTLMAS